MYLELTYPSVPEIFVNFKAVSNKIRIQIGFLYSRSIAQEISIT